MSALWTHIQRSPHSGKFAESITTMEVDLVNKYRPFGRYLFRVQFSECRVQIFYHRLATRLFARIKKTILSGVLFILGYCVTSNPIQTRFYYHTNGRISCVISHRYSFKPCTIFFIINF